MRPSMSPRSRISSEDNDDEAFDLITATDVLPYLGALEPLFFGAAETWSRAASSSSRRKP